MKKVIILFASLIISMGGNLSCFSQETGIQFYQGSWEELQIKAKTEKKNIYLDCYTSWCGPCKNMAKNIYTTAKVGEFYNKNFLCYQMDMEKGVGVELAKKHEVYAYPSHLFFNSDGELIFRSVGFKNEDVFITLGNDALNPANKLALLETEFKNGNRNPAFLIKYVEYQRSIYTNYTPTFELYLDTVELNPQDTNLIKNIFKYTRIIHTKAFELFETYEPYVKHKYGATGIQYKYKEIFEESIYSAAKKENEDMFNEICGLYRKHFPNATSKEQLINLHLPYLWESKKYLVYYDSLESYVQNYFLGKRTVDETLRFLKTKKGKDLFKDADGGVLLYYFDPNGKGTLTLADRKAEEGLVYVEFYNETAYHITQYASGLVKLPDEYNYLIKNALKWVQLALLIEQEHTTPYSGKYFYYFVYAKLCNKLGNYSEALTYAKKAETYARENHFPEEDFEDAMKLIGDIEQKM